MTIKKLTDLSLILLGVVILFKAQPNYYLISLSILLIGIGVLKLIPINFKDEQRKKRVAVILACIGMLLIVADAIKIYIAHG